MRVLVCGGRDYDNYDHVRKVLYALCDEFKLWCEPDEYGNTMPRDIHIIHGGASGADHCADQWAVVNWVPFTEFNVTKEDWRRLGKKAGPLRNARMIKDGRPDMIIAFPGGRGTQDMKNQARMAGIEVREIDAT